MNILNRLRMRELLHSNAAIVLCIAMLIGVYLLVRETFEVESLLPILLIGGCFLMHLFMPHGHGSGHQKSEQKKPVDRTE